MYRTMLMSTVCDGIMLDMQRQGRVSFYCANYGEVILPPEPSFDGLSLLSCVATNLICCSGARNRRRRLSGRLRL